MKKITKASIGVAAVAAVAGAGALVALAYGPSRDTYTMENPADKVTFNSITNNPVLIGSTNIEDCEKDENKVACDERYFVAASEYTGDASQNLWSDETKVEPGKEYVVRMYVHNDAASNLDLQAENVRAIVNLPTTTGTSVTVQGTIRADNAAPKEVWDETNFVSANGQEFNLVYVEGSAKYTNCDESTRADDRTCTSTREFQLGTDLLTEGGAQLGYNAMDGVIPGCVGYSGWVTFHVKAQFAEHPNYEIVKDVKIKGEGEFADSVDAKSGDTLVYKIKFTNTGDVQLNDVILRDTLPAGVTYVPGTTYLVNDQHTDGVNYPDDKYSLFSNEGINIGDYLPGGEGVVYFNVTVNDGLSDECGDKTLRNIVEAKAYKTDGSVTDVKSDTADVLIDGKVCTESFEIDKMVRLENDTEWSETVKAKPGEKIYYRIRFHNTGETDLNDVVVKDKLPEGVENVSSVVYGPITEGQNDDKLTTGEGFFGDGMNIGTVTAGQTIGVYFNATVSGVYADSCEKVDLINTVYGTYGNDDSKIKTDIATVTIDGKICTEENPNYELNKMVQVKGSNEWSENVTVKAGETVRYRIQFKNTGNTTLNNVVISDLFPAGMNYVKGSTILYTPEYTDGKTIGDDFITNGVTIDSLEAGAEATVYFYATVDNGYADDCESTKLTNTVKGKYNNDDNTEKTDIADVTVEAAICDTPEELPKTGNADVLGAAVAIASVSAAAAGYIISRKK